jgi:transcriptional regulator with XRE-family HTH domain
LDSLDIIDKELKIQKKTQKALCEYLGLTKGAFTEWKAGRTASYRTYLPQIADFLGVQVDYLLGRTDIKKAPASSEEPTGEVREMQREVLDIMRRLPLDQEQQLRDFARFLAAEQGQAGG